MPRGATLAQAAAVAALTATLYAFGLAASPPHLTHDEIKFALQAQSIAESGRDINGRPWPLYFQEPGFSVGRDPLCIYVMAGVLRLLPLSETSMRLATVMVGALGAGLIFILARLVFAHWLTPWIVAAVFALSPTYYIHSRLALSVIYPVPFTILWLILLQRYRQAPQPRIAFAVGAVLGAGVYSYLAAALMMPLYAAATSLQLVRSRDWRGVRLVLAGFVLLLVPLLVWQVIEPERYANILSAYRLYEQRPSEPGGALQQLATSTGVISRVNVFWDAFNPAQLFFTGESSVQISTREVGSFLTATAVLLGLGFAVLTDPSVRRRHALLLFGLISAPLPGIILADGEIRRWLVVVPFVAMIAGVGAERLLAGGIRAKLAIAAVMALLGLQFAGFTRDYFGAYRERASLWFGGNIRGALERVLDDARTQPPSAVYLATEIPWVDAYWRFYSKVHHQDLADRTSYVRVEAGEIPPAAAGAVIVTPVLDAALAARLRDSGWGPPHVIPDLDGRPSLLVAAASVP